MAKFLPEIANKGIAVHGFDRFILLFSLVILASARGVTEKDPVGRLVAGTSKSLGVHKGFQPVNRMVIEVLPVLLDRPGTHAQ